MKTVLVTGGNGHLGFNLVQCLVARGYRVRASVRDLNDTARTRHLEALGVELVELDVLKPETFKDAFIGIDGLFHSAAPNLVWARDEVKEIEQPIREGTLNVLNAAREAGVKRIIFTSSCSAAGLDAPSEKPITEDLWNLNPKTTLIRAKIEAEKVFFEFISEHKISGASMLIPSMVGPGFQRHTPNTRLYEFALRGKCPPFPHLGFHIVDSRDAALGHVLAYENSNASGRYIIAGEYFETPALVRALRASNSSARIPGWMVPKSVLPVIAALDFVVHKLSGRPRQLTMDIISEFVGKYQRVSSARAKSELGWQPRSSEETFRDTFNWVTRYFI